MKLSRSLLIILSVFALTFAFTSCEEDDFTDNPAFDPNYDPNNPQLISSNTLVGTWELTSLEYIGTSTTTQPSGVPLTIPFRGVMTQGDYELTFRDNPKTYASRGGYTIELTSNNSGSTFIDVFTITDVRTSGTWNLVGNTLTMTDSLTGQTQTPEIIRATNNTFSHDLAGFTGVSNMGANVNLTGGGFTFQRKP